MVTPPFLQLEMMLKWLFHHYLKGTHKIWHSKFSSSTFGCSQSQMARCMRATTMYSSRCLELFDDFEHFHIPLFNLWADWLFRFVSATRKDYSLSPKKHQTRLVRCMFLLSMLSCPFVRTGNCQMAAQCLLPMSSLDLRHVDLLLLQGKPSDVENRFGKIGGLFGITPIVSRLRDLCNEITNRCFDRRQELIAAVLPMIAAQFWWCQLQLSIDFMIHWPKHSLVYFCFKRFTW